VNLQKMAVNYFEENLLTHKRIYAVFVIRRICMKNRQDT